MTSRMATAAAFGERDGRGGAIRALTGTTRSYHVRFTKETGLERAGIEPADDVPVKASFDTIEPPQRSGNHAVRRAGKGRS